MDAHGGARDGSASCVRSIPRSAKAVASALAAEGRRVTDEESSGDDTGRAAAPLAGSGCAIATSRSGAIGAVIRGETYHFDIVANESARGVSEVALQFGIPIGNGILTCDTDEQARSRMQTKGYEAAQAALEIANLFDDLDDA